MPERMSVKECAEIMKANPRFVRQAIRNGSLVGCYSDNDYVDSFFIPRKAFYKFLGWDKKDIEEYESTKKD